VLGVHFFLWVLEPRQGGAAARAAGPRGDARTHTGDHRRPQGQEGPQEAAGGAGGTGGSDTTGTTTATGGPNELVALAAVHRVGPKRPLRV
jgi:hypothetical protein